MYIMFLWSKGVIKVTIKQTTIKCVVISDCKITTPRQDMHDFMPQHARHHSATLRLYMHYITPRHNYVTSRHAMWYYMDIAHALENIYHDRESSRLPAFHLLCSCCWSAARLFHHRENSWKNRSQWWRKSCSIMVDTVHAWRHVVTLC